MTMPPDPTPAPPAPGPDGAAAAATGPARRLRSGLSTALLWTSMGLLVAMTLLVLFQVFTRYVLATPLPWTEEIARLLVVWLTFVGAGFVSSRNAHIAVDILAVYLPRRLATASQIFALLLVVAAAGYMVWAALSLMVLTGPLEMTASSLPMPLLYGAVLVGYLMILGHTLLNIALHLRHPEEIPDAVEKAASMEGL